MATELTEGQIAELLQLENEASQPPWGITPVETKRMVGFRIERDCYNIAEIPNNNQNPANAANAELITRVRNLLPALLAERRQMRERVAELEPLAAIGQAAVRLYECQCEFADDLSCCSEWQDNLDSLIAAYKDGYEVRVIAMGQNDPMGTEDK